MREKAVETSHEGVGNDKNLGGSVSSTSNRFRSKVQVNVGKRGVKENEKEKEKLGEKQKEKEKHQEKDKVSAFVNTDDLKDD